jgi:hypothetical protein
MNLQKAFELSKGIEIMTKNLRSDLENHNPGITNSTKIGLENINLDAAIIESKLSSLRSMLCSDMV